jgi:hypothetical protein
MEFTINIDPDAFTAQVAERLDHDAIASALDLGELVDNISVSRLSDEMYERYDIAEIAGAIDLGDVAEALYPLIINGEDSLRDAVFAVQCKADEAERRLDSQVERIHRLEQNQVGIAPDQLRRIEDLEARIRLLEASVTVSIPMPEPERPVIRINQRTHSVPTVEEDEVIDLDDFDHVTVRMTTEAWMFLSETLFDHLCSDVLNSKTVTLIED